MIENKEKHTAIKVKIKKYLLQLSVFVFTASICLMFYVDVARNSIPNMNDAYNKKLASSQQYKMLAKITIEDAELIYLCLVSAEPIFELAAVSQVNQYLSFVVSNSTPRTIEVTDGCGNDTDYTILPIVKG